MTIQKVLVTGGAGFIGSNLVRLLLRETAYEVVNLDALTYAGNLDNLSGIEAEHGGRYHFVRGDICDAETVTHTMNGVDAVLHLAAESHVDRSILSDAPFVRTNVMGTQNLLAAARAAGVQRFVHVSTDEVYGELPWVDPTLEGTAEFEQAPRFTEDTPLSPRSPYSASKAGSDLLARAYYATHGMDVVVTRCSNNYGAYQFPEKLIPLMVLNALAGKPLPVYGDGQNVRDWIHVDDHCRGIVAALERGRAGHVYNFGGAAERTNLQVVHTLLDRVGRSHDLIRFVTDRPGHDRRYAIDFSKARTELVWQPDMTFEAGLDSTVSWYEGNEPWWRRVQSGDYRDYLEAQYGERLQGGGHA